MVAVIRPEKFSPGIISIRYQQLEQLGAGGMGTVFRAFDRLSNRYVALKRVSARTEDLWFNSRIHDLHDTQTNLRLALVHEFQTLASLRHPNIIGVLDYGFDTEQAPYFTMELLDNAKNILEAGAGQPLDNQIKLLIETVQALEYLHRRGILHRDLKPANVLVANGQVKVLDFGLSVTREKSVNFSGTIAYMAPELLQGLAPSVASDLYAVGVIAYELIVGRHPFGQGGDISKFLTTLMQTTPDLSSVDARVKPILDRLLEKQATNRYASAHEVIVALSVAINQQVPLETELIRESYLQSAQFVGREAELEQLSDLLKQVITGHGNAWLIGGESGVGKSRLLDELRTEALVRGTLVLRGQAVSDGSSPYRMWQDMLRWLALLSDPNTLEASILKPVVPNIAMLLGRAIPDAPYLDPSGAKTRLIITIVEIIQRQPYAIVMLIEDLQWAGAESLDLLKSMLRLSRNLPLLIIGTYRDDDAPTLPATLTGMQVLKLARLQPESIAQLSVSMIGEAGRQPHLINLLQRETEGNVFFLVEVVRALAEEAGQLDRIMDMTLPSHIIAGGVRQLVQRRLNRVKPENQRLLQIAAVSGRQIDFTLIQAANAGAALDSWLDNCAAAAVLEYVEDRWRFAHDKLREGLLDGLPPDTRRELHRSLATTIEQVYGDSQSAALTYHWGLASDTAKEGHYAGIAGEDALRTGSNYDAVTLLTQALALDPALQVDPKRKTHEPRAIRERQLGQAYFGLGNLLQSREHLAIALTLLGHSLPKKSLIPRLLGQLFRQMGHRAGLIRKVDHSDALILELARIYGAISEICYFAVEPVMGIYCTIKMLNLAEKTAPSFEMARATVNMCIAASLIPLYKIAESYAARAETVATQLEHKNALIQVLNMSAVYYTGTGQWAKVESQAAKAHEIAEQLGDRRESIMSRTTPGTMYHYRGLFEEAAALNQGAYLRALQSGNVQQQGWGAYSKGENLVRLGRLDEAQAAFELATGFVTTDIRRGAQARVLAGLAMVYLRQGWLDKSVQKTEQVIDLIGNASAMLYSGLELYTAVGDVYLTLAEISDQGQQDYLKKAEKGLKLLRQYAKIYPVGKARFLLWEGRYEWLTGKQDDAFKNWQQALLNAEKFELLYDQGLIHYEIGRRLDPTAADRRVHLNKALDLFKQTNASYDVERTQAELDIDG